MMIIDRQLGFMPEPKIHGLPELFVALHEPIEAPANIKGPGAFKTISEAAKVLAVPQHVLRFWESRFRQIRPLKLKGGRRYYRPEDIDLLLRIKRLLYQQGYTIKGARKALNDARRNKLEYLAQTMPTAMPDEEDYEPVQHDLLAQPVEPEKPASASAAPAKSGAPDLQALKQELTSLKALLSSALKD